MEIKTLLFCAFWFSLVNKRKVFCVNITPINPVISIDESLLKFWIFLDSKNDSLISDPDIEIKLTCRAPYPVRWIVTGYQGSEFFRAGTSSTTVENGKLIYSLDMWNYFPDSTVLSVKASCTKYNDTKIASSMSLFISGERPLIREGLNTTLNKGKVIPCLTSNPKLPVQLKKSSGSRSHIVLGANYEPTVGFTFPEPQTGTFTCFSANDFIDFVLRDPYGLGEKLPVEKSDTWLSNEIVHMQCNPDGSVTVRTTLISGNNTRISATRADNWEILVDGRNPRNSTFNCLNSEGILSTIYHFSFIDYPKLGMNSKDGQIDCISQASNKSASNVRCSNTNECFLLRGCFNDQKCRNQKHLFFPGEESEGTCPNLENQPPCISIQTTIFNGLIECGLANREKTVLYEFFTGLRLIKCKTDESWRKAMVEDLIRMDEVAPVLYANESSYFFCEAALFPFAESFHYSISYDNGTKTLLPKEFYKKDNRQQTAQRKVFDFNIVSGIEVKLPLAANELTCTVHVLDEPTIISTSRKFTVKYLSIPSIDKRKKAVTLTRGEEGRLVCKYSGQPPPNVTWTRKSNLEDGIKFVTKVTTDGEAILEFSGIVQDSFSGDYICSAVNRVGNDTVVFAVNVVEPKETTLYLVILGTLSAIFILAIVALYFWKQQRFANKLLRQLTDKEIDEFLNGNRDMWLLNIDRQQDNIDYMPYNSQYEIPITELVLDEKALLGQGQYGMIVKAMYDDNTVAVKTTKPAADVLYFKALLTELKVMIFIGDQINIVKFIGACTEDIRDRKLYIVFELCPLGNLEKYLRDNRENFLDDVGGNKSGEPNESSVLRTSEFVKWSYEIACAMEFLAEKKVVHADLATRNILLTAEKVAKLSDFGLSLKLYQDNNYVKRKQVPLPFRWMAIESLQQLQFSPETDIWSYGVTVWEIFALGDVPFPAENWNDIFVNKLLGGVRLARPKKCPQEIYSFAMTHCWNAKPSLRPSFTILKDYFLRKLNGIKGIVAYSNMDPSAEQKPQPMYANGPDAPSPMYSNTPTEENLSPTYANTNL